MTFEPISPQIVREFKAIMNHACGILLLILMFMTGCNRSHDSGQDATQIQRSRPPTEAELRKLIQPGMAASDVKKMFGTPSIVSKNGDSYSLIYSWPPERNAEPIRMSGFNVFVKNDKVVRWTSIMEEAQSTYPRGPKPSYKTHMIRIFTATETMANVINAVDSDGIASANTITNTADISFAAVIFTGYSGPEPSGYKTVLLNIEQQDSEKVNEFIKTHLGQRVLIQFQNKIIAAPVLSAPENAWQLKFKIKDTGVFDDIANR